ncbi:MAG TPA: MarR family transcriptional regulator [Actinopolymorphaceae bacterium]
MSDLRRQANVLGALALVISDRVDDAVTERSGVSSTAAVALSALYHFLDRPTIDLLRQVLGLTSSGAVRLVDRLVEAGYVERRPGEDRRSTAVTLTRKGRRVAERVAQARESVLGTALSQLSPEERDCLDALMAKLVAGFVRGPGATRWICRLCDTDACGRDHGSCPVANAAARRHRPDDDAAEPIR